MKNVIIIFIALCATGFMPRTDVVEETYVVDTSKSQMFWTGYYVFSFGEHQGTINMAKGEIRMKNKEIMSGAFEFDMNSISNVDMKPEEGGRDLIDHLKSDDFLSVIQYPKAKFVITKVEKIGDTTGKNPNVEITGNLTLKGITHPLTFSAFVSLQESTLITEARFKIDRTKWGVRYNSAKIFSEVGDGAISDAIGIELKIIAVKDLC